MAADQEEWEEVSEGGEPQGYYEEAGTRIATEVDPSSIFAIGADDDDTTIDKKMADLVAFRKKQAGLRK